MHTHLYTCITLFFVHDLGHCTGCTWYDLFCFRFYERWKETELAQAHAQGFSLEEEQLKSDWETILALADQQGHSLEQAHILVLAHILRRPIIVYGVKIVKNYRGENLGLVNFEG